MRVVLGPASLLVGGVLDPARRAVTGVTVVVGGALATAAGAVAEGRVGERVDHRRGVALQGRLGRPPVREAEGPCEPVHPPRGALGPEGVVLVAEGVGQGLDRVVAGHDVAVAVQPPVDLDQGQLAVAGQDGEAGPPEGHPGERHRLGGGRGDRRMGGRGRASAPLPRDGGPQLVPQLLQLGQQLATFVGTRHHRAVEQVEAVEEGISLHLRLQPLVGPHPRASPVGEESGVAEGGGTAADEVTAPVAGWLGLLGGGSVGGGHGGRPEGFGASGGRSPRSVTWVPWCHRGAGV